MVNMKELCKKCRFFDESKVKSDRLKSDRYHCPHINLTVWFALDVYAGCGGFKEKRT